MSGEKEGQELATENQEVQELTQEEKDQASMLDKFISGDEGEEKKEPEAEEVEITEDQQKEIDDFQGLLDKGYDNLSKEEKAKYDEYKEKYNVSEEEEEEVDEEKIKSEVDGLLAKKPEDRTEEERKFLNENHWKDKDEKTVLDLLDKLISEEKYDEISEDDIEFLRNHGHKIDVSDPEPEAQKEEEKEKEVEYKLPSYVEELKNIDLFEGREFKTQEDVDSAVSDFIRVQKQNDQALTDILNKSPELTKTIRDLSQGKKDVVDAIMDNFKDLMEKPDPKEDPEAYAKYVEKQIDRKKAAEAEEERQRKIEANRLKSIENASRFAQNKKLDNTKAREYFTVADKIINQLAEGIYSDEFLEMVYKAQNYEAEVQKAEQRGEVKGANRKITLEKRAQRGDGIKRVVKRHTPRRIKEEIAYKDDGAKMLDDFLNGKA